MQFEYGTLASQMRWGQCSHFLGEKKLYGGEDKTDREIAGSSWEAEQEVASPRLSLSRSEQQNKCILIIR